MKTHNHKYVVGKSGNVQTCSCGKFEWTEKQLRENQPIIEQTQNESKHTPTPWHVGIKQAGIIVYDEKGWAICDCKVFHGEESGEPKENAAFIVKAVNSHEALLRAAKHALQFLDEQSKENPSYAQTSKGWLREAIQQAEGN